MCTHEHLEQDFMKAEHQKTQTTLTCLHHFPFTSLELLLKEIPDFISKITSVCSLFDKTSHALFYEYLTIVTCVPRGLDDMNKSRHHSLWLWAGNKTKCGCQISLNES